MKKKYILAAAIGAIPLVLGHSLFNYVHRRGSSSLKSHPPQFAANNSALVAMRKFQRLPQTTWSLMSGDGLRLVAYLTRNPQNRGTVLLIHGFGVDHHAMDKFAAVFYQLGYNILQPDNRAAGASAGRYSSYGYQEKKDVLLWLQRLQADRQLQVPIILMGASLGAATVLQSLTLSLPVAVKGVIADSSYTSAQEIMQYNIHRQTGLPSKDLTHLLSLWSRFKVQASYRQISPLASVRGQHPPLLLICGQADVTVPAWMSQSLFEAASAPKVLVRFTTGSHIRSLEADPTAYRALIKQFVAHLSSFE